MNCSYSLKNVLELGRKNLLNLLPIPQIKMLKQKLEIQVHLLQKEIASSLVPPMIRRRCLTNLSLVASQLLLGLPRLLRGLRKLRLLTWQRRDMIFWRMNLMVPQQTEEGTWSQLLHHRLVKEVQKPTLLLCPLSSQDGARNGRPSRRRLGLFTGTCMLVLFSFLRKVCKISSYAL